VFSHFSPLSDLDEPRPLDAARDTVRMKPGVSIQSMQLVRGQVGIVEMRFLFMMVIFCNTRPNEKEERSSARTGEEVES